MLGLDEMTHPSSPPPDPFDTVFAEDDLPPTLRDPSQTTPADREPRSTQWFTEAELLAKEAGARESADAAERGRKAVEDYVNGAILQGCSDLFVETGGRKAFAIVLSPRMYKFASARMPDVFAKGYVDLTIGYSLMSAFDALFGDGRDRTETIAVPIYLQVPCYTSDLRMTAVMYSTLEQMKADDAVMHALVAGAALANLGLSAEAFEESRE